MAQLFDRKVVVYVDSLKVTDLRVQFKIEKSLAREPNCSEVSIWNLAPATRAQMQKKGAKVIVEAGYDKTLGQIFYGQSRTIDHARDGASWVTKIQAGDGERAYRHVRLNESFKGGTPVASVLRTVVLSLQRYGLDPGNAFTQADTIKDEFVHGFSCFGKAVDQLDILLKRRGFDWSIQDNRLQLLGPNESVHRTAVLLNAETGLVGSPEHGTPDKEKKKPPVLKAKSLIQASIFPGSKIQLDAENTKGLFKATKVVHEGDTAGGNWFTTAEVVPTT